MNKARRSTEVGTLLELEMSEKAILEKKPVAPGLYECIHGGIRQQEERVGRRSMACLRKSVIWVAGDRRGCGRATKQCRAVFGGEETEDVRELK